MRIDPILPDTSVWIDHLNGNNAHLKSAIDIGTRVLLHPYVLTELALGSLSRRYVRLREMQRLPEPVFADLVSVRALIQGNELWSRGLGFVDVSLLASARLTPPVTLWTSDKRLHQAALDLDVPTFNPRTFH